MIFIGVKTLRMAARELYDLSTDHDFRGIV